MMIDQVLIGISINAFSELIFGNIKKLSPKKKNLQIALEKIYKEALYETETKFKGSAEAIKRVFKDIRIKRRFFNLKGGKKSILEYVRKFAKENLRKKDKDLKIEEAINYFYNIFLNKLKTNENLSILLYEAYLTDLMRFMANIQEDTSKIPFLNKKIDAILKKLKEKGNFVPLGKNNFPFHIGAFQFSIYGTNSQHIISALSCSYEIKEEKTIENRKIVELIDKDYILNSLKIIYNGEPFRIFYPPEDKTVVWIDVFPNKIILTCFSGNFHKKGEIKNSIKNYSPRTIIKEITFDATIVNFFKDNLNNTEHLKYNPRLSLKLKIKNIFHEVESKVGIFGGDAGFLRHPEIKPILDKLRSGSRNSWADVFFFKTKSLIGIYEKPSDFDFHRDGRIIGHIPRKEINYFGLRKDLYNFLIKYGIEFK